jgi:hypothetical protein
VPATECAGPLAALFIVGRLRSQHGFRPVEAKARSLVHQVEARDYNPPKRERVLDWDGKQEFPICPKPEDPQSCNIYRNLDLPHDVYEHIEEFHEKAAEAEDQ